MCFFIGTLMSNGRLVYCDLQAESSERLLKSPLAGHIVTPHYRPHSLLQTSRLPPFDLSRVIFVRLSVRPMPALCLNEGIYRHTFSTFLIGNRSSFSKPTAFIKFQWTPPPLDGSSHWYAGGEKNWRFATEIAVYLGNGTR